MIKIVQKLDEVLDFAWKLSQDDLYASYHRLKSKERVKEYIERAIEKENEKIIAYYNENILCGVCIYFWQDNEKYAQTTMFLIIENYDEIADGFISYIGNELPGFELLIGVPLSNTNANQYFKKRNAKCIDALIDTRLYNLKSHINPNHDLVEEITKNNFEEYINFHDKYAVPLEMYYDGKTLQKEIEHFRVFGFKENEAIHGSIFVKIIRESAEIYGLFIDDEYKNRSIESILIDEVLMQLYNEFGKLREVVYFVEEDNPDELNYALAAGFNVNDTYRCYKYIL